MLYLQIIYPTLRRCPFCFPHPRQDPTVHGMCHGVCNSKNFLLSLSWTEAQKKWDFSHNSKWFVNILAEFPSNSKMVPKDPPFVILIFQTGNHIELWLQDTPALMFVGRGMMRSPIHWEKHKNKIHWGNFLAEFKGDDFCKMMIEFSGMGHYVYCSSMNLNVLGDFDFNVFSSMRTCRLFFVLANQHWDIYTQPKRVSHPLTSSCLVIGERLSQPQRSQRRKHQQQRWWIYQTCSWSSWISSGMVDGFNYGGLSRYVLRCQCFPSGI